jgi:hypothetical protein
MSHTPTPWHVTYGYEQYVVGFRFADGSPHFKLHDGDGTQLQAVVDKLNAHDDLVEALRELLEHTDKNCVTVGDCNQARAALAKVQQ